MIPLRLCTVSDSSLIFTDEKVRPSSQQMQMAVSLAYLIYVDRGEQLVVFLLMAWSWPLSGMTERLITAANLHKRTTHQSVTVCIDLFTPTHFSIYTVLTLVYSDVCQPGKCLMRFYHCHAYIHPLTGLKSTAKYKSSVVEEGWSFILYSRFISPYSQ